MKFIFALVLIGLGTLMIWKTESLIRSFGRNGWAEAKLGSGGTWTLYKGLGLILIFVAFVIMTGGYTRVLDWIFVR